MRINQLLLLLISFFLIGQLSAQDIILKAKQKTIDKGDSVLIQWEIPEYKKIESIDFIGFSDSLHGSAGTIYVKPNLNTTYKIIVKTKKEEFSKSIRITVIEPEIKEFKLISINNNDEDSTKLSWNVLNAEKVNISGIGKDLPPTGEINIMLDSTIKLILIATNKNGYTSKDSLTVEISILEHFYFAKDNVFPEDTCKLKWNFKNTDYVMIDGFTQKFPAKGEVSFTVTETKSIKATIYRKTGLVDVQYSNINLKSPVEYFLLSPVAYKGTQPVLKWSVNKNFTCELIGLKKKIFDIKGEKKVELNTKNKYTLRVKSKSGNIVFEETKAIGKIISPIQNFRIEKEAVKGVITKIYWSVAKGFDVNISNIGNKLPSEGEREIVPLETKTYEITASLNGKIVDRLTVKQEVVNRRKFVKSIRNLNELSDEDELNFEIFSVDDSEYPEYITLYILAVDKKGNFIKGLEKTNTFKQKKIIKKLSEQIGTQEYVIKDFKIKEHEDVISGSYDLSLSLDYSGSMGEELSKEMQKAVVEFIKNKNEQDRVAITKYDHRLILNNSFNGNKENLLDSFKIEGLDTLGGSTALYAGGDFALQTFSKDSKNNKILILFTDGCENSSFAYFGQYAFSAQQLAQNAIKDNAIIHVVAYGDGVNNRVLEEMANSTGGNFYKLHKPEDIKQVFNEFPIILRNFYTIRYKPQKTSGWRSVKMVYNNLAGNDVGIQYKQFSGKNPTISEYDKDIELKYWQRTSDSLNLVPITVPQAIAYFDLNKDILEDQYKVSCNAYAEYLNKNPYAKIIIFGHTDSKGTEENCYELSLKRAITVKNYLISQGVEEERIYTEGCGKTELIWYPEIEKWMEKENRRIEIMTVK